MMLDRLARFFAVTALGAVLVFLGSSTCEAGPFKRLRANRRATVAPQAATPQAPSPPQANCRTINGKTICAQPNQAIRSPGAATGGPTGDAPYAPGLAPSPAVQPAATHSVPLVVQSMPAAQAIKAPEKRAAPAEDAQGGSVEEAVANLQKLAELQAAGQRQLAKAAEAESRSLQLAQIQAEADAKSRQVVIEGIRSEMAERIQAIQRKSSADTAEILEKQAELKSLVESLDPQVKSADPTD